MAQAKTRRVGRDAKRNSGSGVNDNDQPPANAITFTELAVVMRVGEDTLLHRLAAILRKREGGTDINAVEE